MTSKWNNFLTRRRIKKIKIASNISWFTRFCKTTKATPKTQQKQQKQHFCEKSGFFENFGNFWWCIQLGRGGVHTPRLWGFGGGNRIYWPPILICWPDHIGQNIRPEKNLYADFGDEKYDFFDFFQNIAILGRMVNIGFLRAFWGPKGRFPAKYHISGHYRTKYRFSKNRDFFDFLMIFVIFPTWLVAGIGRKWPDTQNIFKNVFFGLFRSIFMPITLT